MADLIEEHTDGVAILTLNRPDRLNALSPAMVDSLVAALERLAKSAEVGAIVLTGSGRGFCAGGDVKAMADAAERDFDTRLALLNHVHRLPMLLHTIPKVVIALVNGPAVGAGLALALACDFRIAAQSASLATGFARVGLSGDYGGTWFMTRLLGPERARDLYFSGRKLGSDEALRLGLVSDVVADDALLKDGLERARRLAGGPRLALGYMKRNLIEAESGTLASVLQMEAIHQARTGTSDDHKEASRAFVEKRAPVFRKS